MLFNLHGGVRLTRWLKIFLRRSSPFSVPQPPFTLLSCCGFSGFSLSYSRLNGDSQRRRKLCSPAPVYPSALSSRGYGVMELVDGGLSSATKTPFLDLISLSSSQSSPTHCPQSPAFKDIILSIRASSPIRYPYFISKRPFSSGSSKFPEYEMPSVTWGVIQGRKEKLVSKVIICDYLKSIGVVPDELERVELPSTVEVMQERVEFLMRIGLNIDDMNAFPLMLGCSMRKNMIPVLGYLEKIGFHRSKLGEFVKSYPQVLHASVVVDLVPVVKFLRGIDIERQDIAYVLQKYPELLGFKLDGTMSTSVAYLVSIGVSPRDIGPMMTQYPYILGMRVGTMIKPIVDYLVSLGLPKKVLARMFEKRPYVLGYSLEESMKPNVESLLSFGIRRESLPAIITQYPQILGMPLKAKLSAQLYFFNLKFKLVTLRIELMKNSFYFFKSEMKRPVQEIVEFPAYFTYSLEMRIKPRYGRASSKGLQFCLDWLLNCSDQRFEERMQRAFIDSDAKGPSFSMGGILELPGNEIVSEEEDDESDGEIIYRRTVSL
ncbi:Transcription termination factor 3 [Nymphaea thermarum]|nr:Transcription termination factor 3 [Nymphaea thermarum]